MENFACTLSCFVSTVGQSYPFPLGFVHSRLYLLLSDLCALADKGMNLLCPQYLSLRKHSVKCFCTQPMKELRLYSGFSQPFETTPIMIVSVSLVATVWKYVIVITYVPFKCILALAGVAQWIEDQPVSRRVAGSIPTQGTCLGCRPGPQLGAHKRQPHIGVSLPLSLPSPLSKNK